jgi:hypothetical protein
MPGLERKIKPRPTLQEAKEQLVKLRETAAAEGIQLPPWSPETRTTLTKVTDQIGELEQELSAAGATQPPQPGIQPAPALKTAESVADRARKFLAIPTPPAFKVSQPQPVTGRPLITTIDPRDMDKEQLRAAIEAERDPDKRQRFFIALCERQNGKPTREIAEIASKATDQELESLVAAETNIERRTMLFRELCRRSRK